MSGEFGVSFGKIPIPRFRGGTKKYRNFRSEAWILGGCLDQEGEKKNWEFFVFLGSRTVCRWIFLFLPINCYRFLKLLF